jgi:two-component system cell cycle sensor histidine kinase/response regulator CckA
MEDKSITVLLIEDDVEYVHLTQEMLALVWQAPFDLKHADRLSAGVEQLTHGTFEVGLLDLSLRGSGGIETFTRVQAQDPRVPIIVLTGLDDESLVNQVMQQGAREYLVKGEMEGDLLASAIRYAINSEQAEEIPS